MFFYNPSVPHSRVSWSNSLVKWTADAGLEETIGICGDLGGFDITVDIYKYNI